MHIQSYLRASAEIALEIEPLVIESMVIELVRIRSNFGKVYVIGLGGSLANAIHMAADLRRLCDIDAYAPVNIAELTAAANDDGWSSIFTGWLKRISNYDCLFVLSVGGGTETVSKAITDSVKKAKEAGATVLGIVGPDGGATAAMGDIVLRVPVRSGITPHTEAFQGIVWHGLVSHPLLQRNDTKW